MVESIYPYEYARKGQAETVVEKAYDQTIENLEGEIEKQRAEYDRVLTERGVLAEEKGKITTAVGELIDPASKAIQACSEIDDINVAIKAIKKLPASLSGNLRNLEVQLDGKTKALLEQFGVSEVKKSDRPFSERLKEAADKRLREIGDSQKKIEADFAIVFAALPKTSEGLDRLRDPKTKESLEKLAGRLDQENEGIKTLVPIPGLDDPNECPAKREKVNKIVGMLQGQLPILASDQSMMLPVAQCKPIEALSASPLATPAVPVPAENKDQTPQATSF